MNNEPVIIILAQKLFWALCGNGPTARELENVIYPAVENINKEGGCKTYSDLMVYVSNHFQGADWVEKGFRIVYEDCQKFNQERDLFETPTGKTFPISWVKL